MLAGKTIIVTGGASGIGRAAAKIFAADGARVMIADRSGDAGEALRDEIRKDGGTVSFRKTDVSDEDQVAALVEAAVEEFGKLDGAFNNAGLQMKLKGLPDLPTEDYKEVMGVNLDGVFYCMKHQIRTMRETGGGAIVNTSSNGGNIAIPFAAEYIASKHGVVGLTRSAASEARHTGVRANAVLPGLIETPMIADLMTSDQFLASPENSAILERHSIGRFGKPEDVALAAKWLLSDESAFINGVALPVDGGYSAR